MLTHLAFRFRPVTGLLTALLIAIGLFALFGLPRREDPDLQGRFAQIIALYPGASAAQVEELVTDPLERTLREVDDISTVTSTSRPGISVIQVEAADRMTGTLAKLMDDLRERLSDVRPSLPSGVVNVQINDRFSDTAALIVSVSRPGANSRDLEANAKTLRDTLRRLPEVGEAKLLGEQSEVFTVAVSSQRIATLSGTVTPETITTALSRRNVLPQTGGSVQTGDTRLTLAPTGELTSVADMENLIVGSGPNGLPVYLRDVATITRGYADPPASRLRVNGQEAVAVSVTMRKGQNISALGESAQKALHTFRSQVPPGTVVTVINDLPRSVARRVTEFFHELQLAVGVIFGVMLLFMGWRSALLVGAMLPVSLLGTFAAMLFAGRDIQQMSIAALIIALALVVDNSIVILDNIEEKMATGLDRAEAAMQGAVELTGPLVTSNLVAILSFLPLAFLPGGVGDFIRDLGLVTSLSLGVSVLLNLTVTPLLCARFLRPVHEEKQTFVQRYLDRGVNRLRDGKASLATWAFKRPGFIVAVSALALFFSVNLIGKLGLAFFPAAERDQFTIDVWLPEGRDIQATERVAARMEQMVQKQTGVHSYVSYIGQGGPRFYYNVSPEAPAANYAQIVVNTESMHVTDRMVASLQREALATIAEARITARRLEQGPPVGAPIAVRVSGENVATLRQIADQIKITLNQTSGTHSIYDTFGEDTLNLQVNVNEDRAGLLGLSSLQVAQSAKLAFSGQTVTLLREGDKEIPVDVRLVESERKLSDVLDLYVAGTRGAVQLRQVANLALTPEASRITRRNGERTVTVFAFTDGSRLPSAVLADVQARLARLKLVPGYRIGYGGEAEETQKSFGYLGLVFAGAFVLNIVILIVQFNSWPLVLSVLAAVPLGVIGAVPGLYLAHQNFGFMAFLGIAALGGIVTNHTIFLFHYAQEHAQHEGISMSEALVEASRRRLRPILLTVLLTVGALLPQAFSGSKLWPPLDWAIIAGLTVSTILTMIVIPSIYTLLSKTRRKPAHVESATESVITVATVPASTALSSANVKP